MKVIDGGFGKDEANEFENVNAGVIAALEIAMTKVKDGKVINVAIVLLDEDKTHTHIVGNYDNTVYALIGLIESCKSDILDHEVK